MVSLSLFSYGYCLVEKYIAALAIFPGWYQESLIALQMLSAKVPLQHDPFATWWLLEHWIQMFRTSYLFRGSSRPHPPIPVLSICQASSASTKTSPCGVVPIWRLCPSPSRVRHLHSACPALYHRLLLHLPHPPHRRNLQDRSDCLR